MASDFPAALDVLTNPEPNDPRNSPTVPHAEQHANANDAIEALQVKVGIDGSADEDSLDFKVAELADVAATKSPLDPQVALEWDGSGTQSVYHGFFWTPGQDLGPCDWEAWLAPGEEAATYWISDGSGGAHAILAGFTYDAPSGLNTVTGNMNGTLAGPSFSSGSDGLAPGEWGHVLIAFDLTTIYTLINGVCCGQTAWTGGVRQSPSGDQGRLFIGGSDHQNWRGKILAVRGLEGFSRAANSPTWTPERPFHDWIDIGTQHVPASFLAVYDRPTWLVEDLSEGWQGRKHPGVVTGRWSDPVVMLDPVLAARVPPRFSHDATLPYGNYGLVVPVGATLVPPATPAGAKVFDSFSRANQTPAFQRTPSLGSTESGSLGVLPWTVTNGQVWGILCGRAYPYGLNGTFALVEVGTSQQDVRVTRKLGDGLNPAHPVTLALRCDGAGNGYAAETANATGSRIILYKITNHLRAATLIDAGAAGTTWTKLRVVVDDVTDTFTLYVDDGAGGWTNLGSAVDVTYQTATKAGLWQYSTNDTYARFDDFTVV